MQIQELKKHIAELEEATINVIMENDVKARYIIENTHIIFCSSRENLFKLENKEKNIFININLDMVYKTIADKKKDTIVFYFDEGMQITIEKEAGI